MVLIIPILTTTQYVYEHRMGVKPGGNLHCWRVQVQIGIGAMDYAINGEHTTITGGGGRYRRQTSGAARSCCRWNWRPVKGIELVYVDTKGMSDPLQMLRALTGDAGLMTFSLCGGRPAS
ncbi:hypothetical protein ACNKHK_18705 [Shigella flexneri]